MTCGRACWVKWAKIEKCRPDTALRDTKDLVDRRIPTKDEGGALCTSRSLADFQRCGGSLRASS